LASIVFRPPFLYRLPPSFLTKFVFFFTPLEVTSSLFIFFYVSIFLFPHGLDSRVYFFFLHPGGLSKVLRPLKLNSQYYLSRQVSVFSSYHSKHWTCFGNSTIGWCNSAAFGFSGFPHEPLQFLGFPFVSFEKSTYFVPPPLAISRAVAFSPTDTLETAGSGFLFFFSTSRLVFQGCRSPKLVGKPRVQG